MNVILCEDIPSLGKTGDVVKVKEGFARNYLIPQKKVFLATANNLKRIEQEKVKRAALDQKAKEEASVLAEKLNKVSITMTVEVNDLDKMYGSVTESDIVRALKDEGHSFEKKDILLEKPIEDLGIFEVGVLLHKEVTAKIRVWVAKK
ncbi:MAG: 50S ribosomal protein L9 [Omnitrophica WOR_2 bacterium GWA2_47_8]|nr:MAG: 50S ribosomal protein L9 [Omnitrophica WOR_2 bacterium GWA2_47_8]